MAVDATIDIIHYGSSGIPPDCGIPQGANFVYSDHNQAGNSTNEGKVMSNINVGSGGNLMGILKDNGNKLKDFQDAVVEKLNDVNVTMGRDGIKVNGVDSITDEFKKYTDSFKNKDMSPKVTVDTSVLAEANKTIAQGVEVQNKKNEILTKKLEYEVEQKITDSEGNSMTPLEAKSNANAEILLEKQTMNKTTIEEITDSISNFFDNANGQAGDTIDLLGSTDGFDDGLNPLSFIFEEFEKDLLTEMDKEKNSNNKDS